ncbi:hypothetical protein SELMODRAFT_134020 [Selaginella moellendorffii]|uniref:Thioredoxin domain-containing protein n=1 Tax=Selaginella moellendorffii TaxID=88036 RepID=D8T7U3_SELML|nr:thioredoxin-like protein Clot [Selaginella moellendorffii]EFJ07219.1 hypothetical protein SELMODRAFT_134020 [Selaginella moellendorffii]|eukprot:XP_002991648.1 thioredoxin-like protein Clot [Selaginella moellendorffii]
MAAAIVDSSVGDLDGVLEAAEKQGGGAVLLLFLGDRIPSIGRSWCPDCVRAEPVIYKEVESAGHKVTLVRVNVGDKPTWRDPAHPLRIDPRFRLTGVPTLIRWSSGTIVDRLEDHEAHLADKVRRLVNTPDKIVNP